MSLRAIIIDDEQKGINALKLTLEKYVSDLKVVAENTHAMLGIECIEDYKPEIVFLDIQMPQMDGFELLEKLKWKNFYLIFTTAHQEYGLKALKNNAIDYLLKPIDQQDLLFAINKVRVAVANKQLNLEFNYMRLLEELHQPPSKKILVNSRSGIESLDLPDIFYFESISNYTQICLNGTEFILSSKTLREFEAQVSAASQQFMRIHNSYMINLSKVLRYLKDQEAVVMQNQQKIPLARSRKEVFFKWLNG